MVVVAILSPNWWRSRFLVGFVGFSELHAAFLKKTALAALQEIRGDSLAAALH
jgi:hypothetical protein